MVVLLASPGLTQSITIWSASAMAAASVELMFIAVASLIGMAKLSMPNPAPRWTFDMASRTGSAVASSASSSQIAEALGLAAGGGEPLTTLVAGGAGAGVDPPAARQG